jgi:hypothetical protein
MQTLDEMLALDLLTLGQHIELKAWLAGYKTPEQILQMPAHLWKVLQAASVQMDFDADLLAMYSG